MNRDAPPRESSFPTLSGAVWDRPAELDEEKNAAAEPPRADESDPVTENSQPPASTTGEAD